MALAFSPLKKVHPVDQPISVHMDGSSIEPVDQPISAHMDGSSIEGAACCGQWTVERKFQLLSISWASVAECVECRAASQTSRVQVHRSHDLLNCVCICMWYLDL